jgi:hypothetical protein
LATTGSWTWAIEPNGEKALMAKLSPCGKYTIAKYNHGPKPPTYTLWRIPRRSLDDMIAVYGSFPEAQAAYYQIVKAAA